MTEPSQSPRPKQTLRALPAASFGAVLGTVGLGLLWYKASEVFGFSRFWGDLFFYASVVLFMVLGFAYIVKVANYGASELAEFRSTDKGGFYSAIPTGPLLMSAGWAETAPALAEVSLWISSFFILLFALLLMTRLFRNNDPLENANGSWFICLVSPTLISLGAVPLGYDGLSEFTFAIGASFWALSFPIVLFRTLFGRETPPALRPTWCIMLVPSSAFFLSYVAINGGVVDGLARGVYYWTLFLAFILAYASRDVWRWPFGISWWAFTFPAVALAGAAVVYAGAIPSDGGKIVGVVALYLATGVVLTVWVRSLKAFFQGTLLLEAPGATAGNPHQQPESP